jgi:ribosomal protein S18 acetylase RimI-like enzyme
VPKADEGVVAYPYHRRPRPPSRYHRARMKIRPAVAADRARILEILVATTRFSREEIRWAMELVDASIEQTRREYAAHVLETPDSGPNRMVQGYVCFGPTPRSEGVYDLYWIAVDPRHQGQGLGQLLLRFVENEVRRERGRMLLIETSSKKSYAPTIRFYQRAGYEEISRIKDFYRIEDDKVVFCKTI